MSLKSVLLAGVLILGAADVAPAEEAARTGQPPPADLFAGTAPANRPAVAGPPGAGSSAPFILERPKPTEDAAVQEGKAGVAAVDVSALRYYAAQNDLARVAAEIRLLRARHPNWEPPADLFSAVRERVDEQPLWDLFAKHDLAGARALIETMRQDKTDWQPSGELTDKLDLAEAHDALVAASDAQRWSDVVDVATDHRALLSCADLDALWRTAEALIRLNDEPRAIEAYRYVLATCPKPQERLATVQKANLLLETPGAIDGLLSLGRRGRDGRDEFESVRLDALRRTIGDAAAGKAGAAPSPKALETLTASARNTPADAQLLGWYFYAAKDFAKAETWFRASTTGKADAKTAAKSAEGLVLALREQGQLREAEALAAKSRDLDAPNRTVFIELTAALLLSPRPDAPLLADQLAAFTQAVETAHAADGAQAFGWHLFNAKDVAGAEMWFRKSIDWAPSENAAVGLMICAKQLRHDRDYADLVAAYRGRFARVAELETALRPHPGASSPRMRTVARAAGRRPRAVAGRPAERWDSAADAIVSTFKAGQYDQALAMLDARKGAKGEPHGLSVVRGWTQYHRGDWAGAQQTFSALEQRAPSSDSETGLRVIQEGYTNPRFR